MKKHLSTVATVLALVIAVVSQFRISNLQSEIHQLENQLNNSVSMLQSNQSAALSRMQELMEQEAAFREKNDKLLARTNVIMEKAAKKSEREAKVSRERQL